MHGYKLAGAALSLLFLAGRSPAFAAVINVTTADQLVAAFATADANPQTFYDIYLSWRQDAQGNTLPWYPSKTLALTKGRVHLHGSNTKNYPDRYRIDGGTQRRVFQMIKPAASTTIPILYLDGITVQNGLAGFALAGGGVYTKDANLYLLNSVFRSNMSNQDGGAIRIDNGFFEIDHILVDGNSNDQFTSSCGGATGGGGGLAIVGNAQGSINSSTFSNNKSCWGGGILKSGTGNLTMWNCTISKNLAKKRGGGMHFLGSGTTTMHFNTIAFNTAGIASLGSGTGTNYGGGLGMGGFGGLINLYGTIIAKNTVTNNPKATLGYTTNDCYWDNGSYSGGTKVQDNIIGELANCSMFGSSFWWGIGWDGAPFDPKLSSTLQTAGSSSGFALPVHMPASDSPVRGNYFESDPVWAACEPLDERYYKRPYANDPSQPRCDIGAVEQGGVP